MKFGIVTVFPDFFTTPFRCGVLGRAFEEGLIETTVLNLRDYTRDKHKTVDDASFGGGAGMVMKPQPLVSAIGDLRGRIPGIRVLALSPGGELFTDAVARRLSALPAVGLVCGRYEGIDQRVIDHYCDGELSIGDYVLSGGEAAALAVIDAVARQVPGVVGKQENIETESFRAGLKYPVYTRPAVFEGRSVPKVLLSGDGGRIEEWRKKAALTRTAFQRPGMILSAGMHRIILELTEFEIESALLLAGQLADLGLCKVLFVSPDAGVRRTFRERSPISAMTAASAKDADEKLNKALGEFRRENLLDSKEAGSVIAEHLKNDRGVVLSANGRRDADCVEKYHALLVRRLFDS
jgi:tRNA (guanine37-N1)-methyltransferase